MHNWPTVVELSNYTKAPAHGVQMMNNDCCKYKMHLCSGLPLQYVHVTLENCHYSCN